MLFGIPKELTCINLVCSLLGMQPNKSHKKGLQHPQSGKEKGGQSSSITLKN